MLKGKNIIKTKSVHRLFALLAFACFAISFVPEAFGVVPPPDGGYPAANTAEGQNALFSLTTGGYNTAVGWLSLSSDTTGSYNVAVGAGALALNTADDNTAIGVGVLLNNTTGAFNTANGVLALFHNTVGAFNTGIGSFVLFNNTTGTGNMAMGDSALVGNTTGSQNVAIGVSALRNSNGTSNVAIGHNALLFNSNGNSNVAVGAHALSDNTGELNTAIGSDEGVNLTTGNSNICIGSGVTGVAGESNTIRIGDNLPTQTGQSACYIGGIYNQIAVGGVPVYARSDGQIATSASSKRFKTDIKRMDGASAAILELKPVTFRYRNDGTKTPCFGLIAEDVAAINPALVVRDNEGKPYSVRYDQVNAMLLNEFLQEHKAFVEEQHKVEQLQSAVAKLVATVNEQASELRKVKAEVHMTKPMMRVAAESP